MHKIPIRNMKSPKKVKPRVFDAVVDDDYKIGFEVKTRQGIEFVYLDEVLQQIKKEQKTK